LFLLSVCALQDGLYLREYAHALSLAGAFHSERSNALLPARETNSHALSVARREDAALASRDRASVRQWGMRSAARALE